MQDRQEPYFQVHLVKPGCRQRKEGWKARMRGANALFSRCCSFGFKGDYVQLSFLSNLNQMGVDGCLQMGERDCIDVGEARGQEINIRTR